MATILIVEDEPVLIHQLTVGLTAVGHEVVSAETAAEGLARASEEAFDLVLLDLRLPDGSGMRLISELLAIDRALPIVLMTAYGSVRDAVEAIRSGAADYLQKPLDMSELGVLIDRLLAERRAGREISYYRARQRGLPQSVLQRDPRLSEALASVDRLCDPAMPPAQRPPILIQGERGSGKALVALAIHRRLGAGPFLEVDGEHPESRDLDALLFGSERSAADPVSQPGLIEAAEGGALLLSDVERLDPASQQRLLDVLSNKQTRRIGSTRARRSNVHVLATTTVDLAELVAQGRFDAQLHQRLSVLALEIPPLRERPQDIAPLALHFAEHLGRQYGNAPRGIEAAALESLSGYDWPGNIRELRNVIERAVLMTDARELGERAIDPLVSLGASRKGPHFELPEGGVDLEHLERDLLAQALERTGGNQSRASALLGLSRDTLRYRVNKWGLTRPNPSRP